MKNKDIDNNDRPSITFYAEREMCEFIKKYVKEKDTNVSQWLRKLIREELAREGALDSVKETA